MPIDYDAFPKPGGDGDFAPTFKFVNVGDSIKGTITRADQVKLDGKDVPVFEVQTEDGPFTVWASNVDLFYKVLEERPVEGDQIAILFKGMENLDGGRTKKVYDLAVKRQAPTAGTTTAPDTAAQTTQSADDLF